MGECFSSHIFCTSTVFLFFILFTHTHIQFLRAQYTEFPSSNVKCSENEWKALVEFKGSLNASKIGRLPSWTGRECCSWEGIKCHNSTGFVQSLDLGSYSVEGRINPSLLKLEHLEYLDLHDNVFEGLSIPAFLGSLKNLYYLDLKVSGFIGEIPPELGNLTNLQHLSLGGNSVANSDPPSFTTYLTIKSLNWVTRLSSLQSFELYDYTNLSECVDWLDSLNKLSSLSSLVFSGCELPSLVSSDVSYVNLTSLLSLDLTGTIVGPTWPSWLFNLTRLEHLKMLWSGLRGPIPNTVENLTALATLDLFGNSISAFPDSLCSLDRLAHIDLGANNLQGSLPSCLANLTSLIDLLVRGNELSGEIPSGLGNLTQLATLDLSRNHFNSTIPPDLGHLQKLVSLNLNDNHLTGEFPWTLGNLSNLQKLDISGNFLAGELSESSFKGVQSLRDLRISGNQFLVFSASSQWLPPFQLENIEMDSVGTRPPLWLQTQRNLYSLYMRNANLSGPVPTSEAINNALVGILVLSGNKLSGSIPDEICNFKGLFILSLANNQLTGKIPPCLGNLLDLSVLDLGNNRLSGQIPMELGFRKSLISILHLNGNSLYGELPKSLQNLTLLHTLDLGKNELQGCIPSWIGKELSRLNYLRLESNNFSCEISLDLCQLPFLQILNLAHNNLVGTIPHCLANLGRMSKHDPNGNVNFGEYTDTLLNTIKGIELEYSSTLPYTNFISLSGNHLHGEIPEELMNLTDLQSLSLSNNDLTGRIPETIGNMRHLESLDLSMNQLSGAIPQSLANTDALAYLNLSFNNLEGRIPSGNHFDTLVHPSTFEGNIGVCGKLLNKSCPRDDDDLVQSSKQNGSDSEDDGGEFEWSWIYAGIGPGFAVGFLGVIFILYYNEAWRCA